jgi:hypothetical protein
MTYPVFASGDVLQAADMNAVGLWLVKSQTIGSAVSTVTVSDAFSTNYDNYKIIVSGGVGSTTGNLRLTFGATTSGYGDASMGNTLASGTFAGGNNEYNTASYIVAGSFTSNVISADIEVQNPFTAKNTIIYARHLEAVAGGNVKHIGGVLANTTSYTAFTFTTSTGTITGGTIKVYGYRN